MLCPSLREQMQNSQAVRKFSGRTPVHVNLPKMILDTCISSYEIARRHAADKPRCECSASSLCPRFRVRLHIVTPAGGSTSMASYAFSSGYLSLDAPASEPAHLQIWPSSEGHLRLIRGPFASRQNLAEAEALICFQPRLQF